ncbi:hypothetical protein AFK68_02425, partial [Hydrocoleum sp. CS-953]
EIIILKLLYIYAVVFTDFSFTRSKYSLSKLFVSWIKLKGTQDQPISLNLWIFLVLPIPQFQDIFYTTQI